MFGKLLLNIGRLASFACNPAKESLQQSSAKLFWSLGNTDVSFRLNVCRHFAVSSHTVKIKQNCPTAFIIFANEKRESLKEANPGIHIKDVSRMLGQMWRLLPDNEKEIYRKRYAADKVIFEEENKLRMEKLTESEKAQIVEDKRLKRKHKKDRKLKKLRVKFGMPKREIANPYVLYVRSKLLERGDAPVSQYFRGVAEFWKKMAEDDKQPFIDEAHENRAINMKRLAEWEEKMIAEGFLNLVLKSHLVKTKPSRAKPVVKKTAKRRTTKKKDATEYEETDFKDVETTVEKKPKKARTPKMTAAKESVETVAVEKSSKNHPAPRKQKAKTEE